jgi:hypothetical protein
MNQMALKDGANFHFLLTAALICGAAVAGLMPAW